MDIKDIMKDEDGKRIIHEIEVLTGEKDPASIKMRTILIGELKDRFGYDWKK